MIDWILLFAAFGLGGLTTHFVQQWSEQRRRLEWQRARVDAPRDSSRR
jgi:hypothetical protein